MKTPDRITPPETLDEIDIESTGNCAALKTSEWLDESGLVGILSENNQQTAIAFERVVAEVIAEHGDKAFEDEKLLELIAHRFVPHLKRNQRELVRATQIDTMTGLANVAAYERAKKAAEEDPGTSFIFIDANNFGKINKKRGLGKPVGDSAIKYIANHLKVCVQEVTHSSERIFRVGGDEFVIMVNGDQADELRDLIASTYGDELPDDDSASFIRSRGKYETKQGPIGYMSYDGIQVSLAVGVGANEVESDDQSQEKKKALKKEVERGFGKKVLRILKG